MNKNSVSIFYWRLEDTQGSSRENNRQLLIREESETLPTSQPNLNRET